MIAAHVHDGFAKEAVMDRGGIAQVRLPPSVPAICVLLAARFMLQFICFGNADGDW